MRKADHATTHIYYSMSFLLFKFNRAEVIINDQTTAVHTPLLIPT